MQVFCVEVRAEGTVNATTQRMLKWRRLRTEVWGMSTSSKRDDKRLGSSPEKSKTKVTKRNLVTEKGFSGGVRNEN